MATYKNLHAVGTIPMPVPFDQAVVAERMTYALPGAILGAGDIVVIGYLPEECSPVDLILDTDAMGASATMAVGLLNAGQTDIEGTPFLAATAVATATAARADVAGLRAMSRVANSDTPRAIGIKAATATVATTGTVGVTLMYRAT